MKLFCCVLPALLVSCTATKYSVGGAPDQCDAEVRCLPNGNCVFTCTDASGATCEVELSCANGQCTVVRSDCPPDSCCAASSTKK